MASKVGNSSRRRVFLRSDPIRALWHDTSPVEVPLIISNDGLHQNLSRLGVVSSSGDLSDVWDISLPDGWIGFLLFQVLIKGKSDIPLDFGVYNAEGKYRVVSLPHLRSQVKFSQFLFLDATRILEATNKSRLSLRAPRDVSFDRIKGEVFQSEQPSVVNEQSEDKAAEVELKGAYWPRQFFLYRGYRRLYKFLGSRLFMKNEERYRRLLILDVQSAFPNIYTHSISWALRGKDHSKSNIRAVHDRGRVFVHPLGDYFDKLMQSSNDSETNGILVGPEVSRIFAEIIFQDVDVRVLSKLRERNVRCSIYRYVDNFYAFCESDGDADLIHSLVSEELTRFRLRLNSEKTKLLRRPFVDSYGVEASEVGRLIDRYRSDLEELKLSLTAECEGSEGGRLSGAGYRKLHKWKDNFLNDVRAVCAREGGWNVAASRMPGLIREDSNSLIQGHVELAAPVARTVAWLYIEMAAYFVMVRPTDSAGMALCAGVMAAVDIMRSESDQGVSLRFGEKVYFRLIEVLESLSSARVGVPLSTAGDIGSVAPGSPVLVNVLSVMVGLPDPYRLSVDEACRFLNLQLEDFSDADYFKVVGFVYYFNHSLGFVPHEKKIITRAADLLSGRGREKAGVFHLALDLLSCKTLQRENRKKLLDALRRSFEVPPGLLERVEGKYRVLAQFEAHPWFVDWDRRVPLRQRVARRVARQIY